MKTFRQLVNAKRGKVRKGDGRKTAAQRGYGSRWQKARRYYLDQHPLCVQCKRNGRITAANEVDHIDPHRGDMEKFWLETNWQALCKRCHSRKTARGG